MIKALLGVLFRPPLFALSFLLHRIARLRLGPVGVVELTLDGSVKHPLLSLRALELITALPGVRGVVVDMAGPRWGWATLHEWRELLVRLRARGLLVVVCGDGLDNGGMFLASAADQVVLPPLAEVSLVGVGGNLTFFGPALTRLGVRMEVEAAGEYKSIGEAATRGYPSAENREAVTELIEGIHEELIAAVAEGRGLEVEVVRGLIQRAPLSVEEARLAGLIDAVGHHDAVDELLERELGEDAKRTPAASLNWLAKNGNRLRHAMSGAPALTVLHLEGNVVMGAPGSSTRSRIAAREVCPIIRALREADAVKGVVISVKSPGGSALASELIWREVELLGRRKPVVAWFFDVAASGGFYLAAAANEIVARPGTLTGSIGVVGGKLVVGDALGKLGVHSEAVLAGPNADIWSPMRGFNTAQRALFRKRLQETYDLFVKRVADGRHRSVDAVEPFARGRVWTGRAAEEHGLIDRLGGLDDAIERLRALVGVRPGQTIKRQDLVVEPRRPFIMRFLPTPSVGMGPLGVLSSLGVELPAIARAVHESPNEALAMMPFDLEL